MACNNSSLVLSTSLCSTKPFTRTLWNTTNLVSIAVLRDPAFKCYLPKWHNAAWFQSLCPSLCPLREVRKHQLEKEHRFPMLRGLTFKTAKQHPPQKCVRSSCSRRMEAKREKIARHFCAEWVLQWIFKPSSRCLCPWTPASPHRQCFWFNLFPVLLSWFISRSSRQHPTDYFRFFLFLICFLHRFLFSFLNSGTSKVSVLLTVVSLYTVQHFLTKKLFFILPFQTWVTLKRCSLKIPHLNLPERQW